MVFIVIQMEPLVSMFCEMVRSHESIVRRVVKILLHFILPVVKCFPLERKTDPIVCWKTLL
jgi:hypothetical protein